MYLKFVFCDFKFIILVLISLIGLARNSMVVGSERDEEPHERMLNASLISASSADSAALREDELLAPVDPKPAGEALQTIIDYITYLKGDGDMQEAIRGDYEFVKVNLSEYLFSAAWGGVVQKETLNNYLRGLRVKIEGLQEKIRTLNSLGTIDVDLLAPVDPKPAQVALQTVIDCITYLTEDVDMQEEVRGDYTNVRGDLREHLLEEAWRVIEKGILNQYFKGLREKATALQKAFRKLRRQARDIVAVSTPAAYLAPPTPLPPGTPTRGENSSLLKKDNQEKKCCVLL